MWASIFVDKLVKITISRIQLQNSWSGQWSYQNNIMLQVALQWTLNLVHWINFTSKFMKIDILTNMGKSTVNDSSFKSVHNILWPKSVDFVWPCTVNQLFLVTSLFHNLLEINWFTATYFCDQDADYLKIIQ